MLKNIVVATKSDVAYYKIMEESCKRHNIELVVLGMGKKWNGLADKYKYWNEYLNGNSNSNKLKDDEVIMLNDAYDVIFLDDADIILSKYHTFNKPIVCSVQKGPAISLVFPKCLDEVICTGNIIGRVGHIRQLVKIILKYKDTYLWDPNSDQINFNKICKYEPFMQNNIGLDIDQTLFYVTVIKNLWFQHNLDYLVMKDGRLYKDIGDGQLSESISVLHLAANIDGNKYLEYLGYDTSDKSVGKMGSYKIGQILTYIGVILKNNKNIVFSIGIFVIIIVIILLINLRLKQTYF